MFYVNYVSIKKEQKQTKAIQSQENIHAQNKMFTHQTKISHFTSQFALWFIDLKFKNK